MRCELSTEALEVIKGLLNKNKGKRMTLNELITHPYFSNFKFNEILDLEALSPLKSYFIDFKEKFTKVNKSIIEESENSLNIKNESKLSPINKSLPFDLFNIFEKEKNYLEEDKKIISD